MKGRAAALVFFGALSSGCVVTVDSHSEIAREEKRFAVTGIADVRLTTFDGSIHVESWDRSEVVIEIEKRGPSQQAIDGLTVSATQNGNQVAVEVKRPRSESLGGLGLHRSAHARLLVTVPRATNVWAKSGDGPIAVEGVSGRVELRTGDGSVRAAEVSGDLIIDTGDGSVSVAEAEGRLTVATGDGGVSVSGRLDAVRVHTGDGSVACRASEGSSTRENWDITTGDGSVSLYLPRNFSADIDAHTGDGRIINDLAVDDVERPERRDEHRRRTLRARIGSGGKLLRVRTGDGAIRLKAH